MITVRRRKTSRKETLNGCLNILNKMNKWIKALQFYKQRKRGGKEGRKETKNNERCSR